MVLNHSTHFKLINSISSYFYTYRDIRNSQKIEHIIQVQLRFCLLETSSEQEDYFPPNVIVKVNNKLCPLPVSVKIFMENYSNHSQVSMQETDFSFVIAFLFAWSICRIPFRQTSLVLNQNDHHDQLI